MAITNSKKTDGAGKPLKSVIGALEKFGNEHLAGLPTAPGNEYSHSAEETFHCQDTL